MSATRAGPRTAATNSASRFMLADKASLFRAISGPGFARPGLRGHHLLGVPGGAQVGQQLAELLPDDRIGLLAHGVDQADEPFGRQNAPARRTRSGPSRCVRG